MLLPHHRQLSDALKISPLKTSTEGGESRTGQMESTDSSAASQQPKLPPGFRFHPTDEELVVHYLKKKVASAPLPVSIMAEIDLYKFDPWELPAKSIFGDQEWYFFSPRDRKYPNGARPNRAATSGYWKATGTDKPVLTANGTQKVGVKKALVFYSGKPPRGVKSNWIMHEYRLADNGTTNPKPPSLDVANKKGSLRLDDWVLCRIYKKNNVQRPLDQEREVITDHDMIGAIHPSIPFPFGLQKVFKTSPNYGSLLQNDHHNMYQGMVSNDPLSSQLNNNKVSQLPFGADPNTLLSGKRLLHNFYWNEEEANTSSPTTKRFLTETSCDGSSVGRNDENTNSIGLVLSQMPQTNPMQQIGNLGLHQTYQVPGMLEYSKCQFYYNS